ncbi:MAG: cyclic nucleotide-binding/CBS domain-containing protein [Deltaproteobacteria bacterium]|nr:cyclic nucleotide-binding/CBS domain-containing protein [Deltaproteobacteria bacterium]
MTHDESYTSIVIASQAETFLSQVDPFSFLPDKEIEKVAAEVLIAHYKKDKILFTQGQSTLDYIYIIQKGAAERYFEDDDEEKRLSGILMEGQMFGGISILVNHGVPVRTLKLAEKTYFYLLPKSYFLKLCENYEVFSEYFTDTFGKRMMNKSYSSIISGVIHQKDDTLHLYSQPVKNIFNKKRVTCSKNITIQEVATKMIENGCSSILVQDANDRYIGIVTGNDFRKKVVSAGYDIKNKVEEIMSTPLLTISSDAMVFEGLMQMMQLRIKHLAVTDIDDKVIGVISNNDFLKAQENSPFFLVREITQAQNPEEITSRDLQLPKVIRNMVFSGAKAQYINKLVTTLADVTLDKMIKFTLDEMGPPPAKFAFMIFGSEGRKEQTLKTDQDNAIMFEDVPEDSLSKVNDYFLKFGEKVCTRLNDAGYDFCTGGIMAKNPKWCQPISVWKKYFTHWIHKASPEDLLQSSIFFDFQGAYGDTELVEQLRRHLFGSLGNWSGFLRYLTENALHFKPPLGFFRNFVVESKGKHRNGFDIKAAMMPIVDFARIYALKNGIEETNTLERLRQLHKNDHLNLKEYEEIKQAYSFLMQLRLVRQVKSAVEEKQKPDNYIYPDRLSSLEQRMLKEIFKKITSLQSQLNYDFMGGI